MRNSKHHKLKPNLPGQTLSVIDCHSPPQKGMQCKPPSNMGYTHFRFITELHSCKKGETYNHCLPSWCGDYPLFYQQNTLEAPSSAVQPIFFLFHTVTLYHSLLAEDAALKRGSDWFPAFRLLLSNSPLLQAKPPPTNSCTGLELADNCPFHDLQGDQQKQLPPPSTAKTLGRNHQSFLWGERGLFHLARLLSSLLDHRINIFMNVVNEHTQRESLVGRIKLTWWIAPNQTRPELVTGQGQNQVKKNQSETSQSTHWISPKERTTNLSIQSISLLTFPATRNFTTGLRVHLQHFSGLRSWALPFSESISLISSHAGPSSLGHRCYTGALPAHYNSLLAIRPPPLSSWGKFHFSFFSLTLPFDCLDCIDT
ncbi:hypothetical protein VP01_87g3 [Puccinia sorghi]|uniref:Uncharacterized protein n=1 Tax=Puccinia sorghi TaxID=27349 RepID=A0A0L6UAI5_9BASI|nr:hypothetical protein VP01_87g3 [Puccinia sorghi]